MFRKMQQSTALHQGNPQQWAAAILGGQFFQSVGGISRLRAVARCLNLEGWSPPSKHSFGTAAASPPQASDTDKARASASDSAKRAPMKDWSIIRRFVIESAVKRYGSTTLADEIFVLHGPCGVGKRTAVKAALKEWAGPQYAVAHVDLYTVFRSLGSSAEPSRPWLTRLYPKAQPDVSAASTERGARAGPGGRADAKTLAGGSGAPKDGGLSPSFPSLFLKRTQRLLRQTLEDELLSVVQKGVEEGHIRAEDVFWALTWKRHVDAALECHLAEGPVRSPESSISFRRLQSKAGPAYAKVASAYELVDILVEGGDPERAEGDSSEPDPAAGPNFAVKPVPPKDTPDEYTARLWLEALVNVPAVVKKQYKEESQVELALRALYLARNIVDLQGHWRNRSERRGSVAGDAAVAWSVLLIDLLSATAKEGRFEPKLVIHGLELLRQAPLIVPSRHKYRRRFWSENATGAHFHDQLILKLMERVKTLPVILTASDGYYSSRFDTEQKFLASRVQPSEYFGWTGAEAAVHLVPRVFSPGQWARLNRALGLNVRHLAEFHSLWAQGASSLTSAEREAAEECSHFARALEEYLKELEQESFRPVLRDVVRRVAERGRKKWGAGRSRGRGVLFQWDDVRWTRWAILQVLDFLRALQRAGYGVNYVNLAGSEFLEDEVARALMEAGLLYQQRDPPYIRPVTKAFQDLLEGWFRDQWVKLSLQDKLAYAVLRVVNGRYYRHLVKPSLGRKEFVLGEYRYV